MRGEEYVRFSDEEVFYSTREFLQIQLELLKSIQFLRKYKELRNEEYALKIVLKSKVEEAHKLLEELEKFLPKTAPKEEKTLIPQNIIKKEKEHLSLEQEIDEIKRKLAKISNH